MELVELPTQSDAPAMITITNNFSAVVSSDLVKLPVLVNLRLTNNLCWHTIRSKHLISNFDLTNRCPARWGEKRSFHSKRVSWCHINDEPLAFSAQHSLKRFSHNLMVPTLNEARPHLLNEWNEARLSCLSGLSLLQVINDLEQLFLLIDRHRLDLRKDGLEVHVIPKKNPASFPTGLS